MSPVVDVCPAPAPRGKGAGNKELTGSFRVTSNRAPIYGIYRSQKVKVQSHQAMALLIRPNNVQYLAATVSYRPKTWWHLHANMLYKWFLF